MIYTIHVLFTLIYCFIQYPHYYYEAWFLPVTTKIKPYFIIITRSLFTYSWIGHEIAKAAKHGIYCLPSKGALIGELPQHCRAMHEAFQNGHIYVPSIKGARYDGCVYDPLTFKIIKVLEFKTKEEGTTVVLKSLERLYEKYAHLDELNISFKSYEGFILNKTLIESTNLAQLANGVKLKITCSDISTFKFKSTCLIDIYQLSLEQVLHNKLAAHVNTNLISEYGVIVDFIRS
jgi:hypothetical protein